MEKFVNVSCKGYTSIEVTGDTEEEIKEKIKELGSDDIHYLVDFNFNDLEWKIEDED